MMHFMFLLRDKTEQAIVSQFCFLKNLCLDTYEKKIGKLYIKI